MSTTTLQIEVSQIDTGLSEEQIKGGRELRDMPSAATRIIRDDSTWIESNAEDQIKRVAEFTGMKLVVGLPDLHVGAGYPIGMAAASCDVFYPELVGGDIGCGMSSFRTSIPISKMSKVLKRADRISLDSCWPGDVQSILEEFGVKSTDFNRSLGTIGEGNHFAEFQKIGTVHNQQALESLGYNTKEAQLLIHSGSRSYGQQVLDIYKKTRDSSREGASPENEAARTYLEGHNDAVKWACANRELIARRLMDQVKGEAEQVLDLPHNFLEVSEIDGEQMWLHRKGAAPADRGAVIIPGSREHASYLVMPTEEVSQSAFSLAHGAGRRISRTNCKASFKNLNPSGNLYRNKKNGSMVRFDNKDTFYEEAGGAYKDIETVIAALEKHGLIEVIATFEPLLTIKL